MQQRTNGLLASLFSIKPSLCNEQLMIKIEYKVIEIDVRNLEKELNAMGEQGWDVSFHSSVTQVLMRIVLKRQQPSGTLALLG
jgi:hypothetical protein